MHANASGGEEQTARDQPRTHVDNSLADPAPFLRANMIGTFTIPEAVRRHGCGCITSPPKRCTGILRLMMRGGLTSPRFTARRAPVRRPRPPPTCWCGPRCAAMKCGRPSLTGRTTMALISTGWDTAALNCAGYQESDIYAFTSFQMHVESRSCVLLVWVASAATATPTRRGPPVSAGAQPSWEVPRPSPRPSSGWPTARKGVLSCGGCSMRTADDAVVRETQVELLDSGHLFLSRRPSPDNDWFVTVESARAVSSH